MGYNITIGEAELETETEEELYCTWTVNLHSEPNAPVFEGDDTTGNTNMRSPSYSQWTDFCKKNGLYDLFYNEDYGLMREHPGCFLLKQKHLDTLKKALEKLEEVDKRPAGLDERYIHSYSCEEGYVKIPDSEETHSYDKVRLIWLIWWVDWALKNCKQPAIKNC